MYVYIFNLPNINVLINYWLSTLYAKFRLIWDRYTNNLALWKSSLSFPSVILSSMVMVLRLAVSPFKHVHCIK